jgi:hypothetical protein
VSQALTVNHPVDVGPTTLSGVIRVELGLDEEEREGAFVKWPGERVETTALIPPSMRESIAPVSPPEGPLAHVRAVESLFSDDAVKGAMLAVVAISAGCAALIPIVAIVFFP